MRRTCLTTTITFMLVCSLASVAAAQSRLTWRGAPVSETKSFLITECGYNLRLVQSQAPHPGGHRNFHFSWEFGWLRNIAEPWAVGGTGYLSVDDDGSRIGIKLRARRWLGPRLSLDLGAGPIVHITQSYLDEAPGLVASAAVTKSDLVAATFVLEMIPYREYLIYSGGSLPPDISKGLETTVYAGLRLGSQPGAGLAVAIPLAVAIWFLATYEA